MKASIEKATADITSYNAELEELAGTIATDSADLKAATDIREKEAADFAATEKELVEVIGTLERAIMILEREMNKGGASLAQIRKLSAGNLIQALSALVDAVGLKSDDAAKLTAFVQNSEDEDDDSEGAPDPTVYASHSGSIVETLEGLLEKAKDQLDSARTEETNSLHAFEVMKQSLEDGIKFGEKETAEAKKSLAGTTEAKATAEGDLAVTSKDLAEDIETLGTLKHDCMTKAEDYEVEVKSRAEELKALAEAKKAITEMTSGAESLSYGLDQVSLLQEHSELHTGADLANFEAVRLVRDLARREHDQVLAQLAARMSAAMQLGSQDGEDPFGKVKGLIMDMIERLESEAKADASHKAYCDKQTGESLTKKAETEANIEKLSTKIDSMKAKSVALKDQVAVLQKDLADLASSQAAMDKMRQEEHTAFVTNKADMEKGLEGVKMALRVLTDYYNKAAEGAGHDAAAGAGEGIIGLLEVVESDFSKGLAEMTITENTAQADYDKETKENEISKVTKEQDIKYKTKDFTGLDSSIAEASSDLAGEQAELAAVNEYLAKLDDMCIAKPDTYEEAKKRRSAEIAGLKEALQILQGEAFLQKKSYLRGIHRVM